MAPEELKREDWRRLRLGFAAAYDRSRLESLLAAPGSWAGKRLEPLGEGRCFESWGLPGGELVLKRARPDWVAKGPRGAGGWLRSVQLLKSESAPLLIPPFELLTVGEEIGLVMPYGRPGAAGAAAHWGPIDRAVAGLHRDLAARGLVLRDVIQIAVRDGTPFVYDLSDLAAL